MSLGPQNPTSQILKGDTAELYATLYINGQPVTEDQITQVTFTVQLPDLNTAPTVNGIVMADGRGYYQWTTTTLTGEYIGRAQFHLVTGEIRSVMTNFVVFDPFNPPTPNETDLIVESVMLRLEDCFDSLEGGPWLRDKTLAQLDYTKIADFIPEALFDINLQMPPTNFTLDFFTAPAGTFANPNMPLLIKGVLILVIRHLMRSYVEQPIVQGGKILWEDRTRYTQMWTTVYQIEYQDYVAAIRLWKRTEYHFGHSALLTLSKAGRLFPFASMRTRGIGRGRGYY